MYSLDEMIKIFLENADICKKEYEELIKNCKEEFPDETLPEWLTRDFCINTALATICQEIEALKTRR